MSTDSHQPAPRTGAFLGYLPDALLVGGGALPVLLAIHGLHLRFPWIAAETCSLLIISPHYLPTWLRLYARPRSLNRHGFTAYAAPFLIALLLCAASVAGGWLARLFVTLYGVWRLYHYSGQSYGVACVYADRAGFTVTPALRRSVLFLLFGSAYWYLFSHPYFFTAPLLEPLELGNTARCATAGLIAVVGLHPLGHLARWQWRTRSWRPPLFAVPVAAHLLFLFATPRSIAALSLAGVFHSTQYLFFSWIQAREDRAASGAWTAVGRWYRSRHWWLLCGAGGAALYATLHALGWALQRAGAPTAYAPVLPILAINFHHFLADGVLWRRERNPELRGLRHREGRSDEADTGRSHRSARHDDGETALIAC